VEHTVKGYTLFPKYQPKRWKIKAHHLRSATIRKQQLQQHFASHTEWASSL